jgi:hypothetical protein
MAMERLHALVNKVLPRPGDMYNNIDEYIEDEEPDCKRCDIDIFHPLSADDDYDYFCSSCIALMEDYCMAREKELEVSEKERERAQILALFDKVMPRESQLCYDIRKSEENEKPGCEYGDADPFRPLSADDKYRYSVSTSSKTLKESITADQLLTLLVGLLRLPG